MVEVTDITTEEEHRFHRVGKGADEEMKEWCRAQPSTGRFIYTWRDGWFEPAWHFEHERDAILFKLKWGSHTPAKRHDHINWDVSSLYPDSNEGIVIKVMKNRMYGVIGKSTFADEHLCTFTKHKEE